ncbi:protease modulator HflC [Isoalcanivorax indicus]|uniref:protease modulator HflC n=1 Tax=Isoalcanivorax indicus TaxID=2202653 RepID=UPI001FEB8514|nr:protease modulator HflC [Isoalcanivorax indicus]
MSPRSLMGLVAALFLVIVALDSYFIVNETERAVLKRFQEIVRTDIQPGIHGKMPFIDQVLKVDGRATAYELPAQSYLTSERKLMDVSSFVIWRVDDVQKYVTVIGGGGANNSERMREIAQQRLNARVAERLRNAVAQRTVQQVVAGRREVIVDPDSLVEGNGGAGPREVGFGDGTGEGDEPLETISAEEASRLDPQQDAREQLMVAVLAEVKGDALEDFGIDVVDIRLKQVDWPDEVRERVFERMRAERARDAARHRSEGREAAEIIRAQADRQRTVLLADAFRDAERTRGEGDATAARIYADAYNRDREFYSFYRSLQAYRETFRDSGDVMVLEPDGDFFRYLKSSSGN